MSLATAKLTGPSDGCRNCCIWPRMTLRSGIPCPPKPALEPPMAVKNPSIGVPLNGSSSPDGSEPGSMSSPMWSSLTTDSQPGAPRLFPDEAGELATASHRAKTGQAVGVHRHPGTAHHRLGGLPSGEGGDV